MSGRHSCLEFVELRFTKLTSPPRSLALNGAALGNGLPPRQIPLDELRRLLIKAPWPSVQAVWQELVRRGPFAEGEPDSADWIMAAVGMALPALKKVGNQLSRHWPGDRADLDAELLEGFLQGLHYMEPTEIRIFWRLREAAQQRGREACNREKRLVRSKPEHDRSESLRPRGGNPDLVLATALLAGALTKHEADLLYEFYLIGTPPQEVAERLGLAVEDLDDELARAVHRLTDHLERPEGGIGAGG